MVNSGAMQVEIRGVVYQSVRIAAAMLDITPETIYAARKKGTLHRVGLGRVGVEPMPVLIKGRVFKDARFAAKHYKVTVAAIYNAIADGDPDRIARKQFYNGWKSQPYTVGGYTFASKRAAARALGFANDEFIAHALRVKSKRGLERILAAGMAYAARQDQRKVAA